MGVQSRNAPLSPVRKWWVEGMSNSDRRTHLIAERLEAFAVARKSDEAAAIRGFLSRFRRATGGGNPAGITLMVRRVPKAPNHAIVVPEMPGVGRITWLPAIVVPWTDHFERIMRECGDLPAFPEDRVRKADAWGQPEQKRGGFDALPEVRVRMVFSK